MFQHFPIPGPFKHQARSDATWGPVMEDKKHFQCRATPDSDALLLARKYQLMDLSVQVYNHKGKQNIFGRNWLINTFLVSTLHTNEMM